MEEEEKVVQQDSLVVRGEDGKVMISQAIEGDLYGYADQVKPEDSLDAFDEKFHQDELARDTAGLRWRTHMIGINHNAGTFNLEDLGLKDFSPADIRVQVIAHSPNRALWRLHQDKEDKTPMCSSLDAVTGSIVINDAGDKIKCENCVYGQWWNPLTLLAMVKEKGPQSSYAGVAIFINEQLKKSNTSLEILAETKKDKNVPPPCKQTHRLFAMLYDHTKKMGSSQPVVMIVPPTSNMNWEKYKQDLSQRKIRTTKGKNISLTLMTTLAKVSLKKEEGGPQVFSRLEFEFDVVAPPQLIELCTQIRDDWEKEVMSFTVQMGEFDPSSAEDPTQMLPDKTNDQLDTELPPTMELDEEGVLI